MTHFWPFLILLPLFVAALLAAISYYRDYGIMEKRIRRQLEVEKAQEAEAIEKLQAELSGLKADIIPTVTLFCDKTGATCHGFQPWYKDHYGHTTTWAKLNSILTDVGRLMAAVKTLKEAGNENILVFVAHREANATKDPELKRLALAIARRVKSNEAKRILDEEFC